MEEAQYYSFHQEMMEILMTTVVQLVSAQVYTLIVLVQQQWMVGRHFMMRNVQVRWLSLL